MSPPDLELLKDKPGSEGAWGPMSSHTSPDTQGTVQVPKLSKMPQGHSKHKPEVQLKSCLAYSVLLKVASGHC